MGKPIFGLLLGAFLGVLDGSTAWFSAPEVRPKILEIVFFSMIKGLVAGVLIGFFAKKVRSLPLGIVFGLIVGAFFAYLVAMQPNEQGGHYYWEIMLPGSILGMIVGYATQKHGAGAGAPAMGS
jgi:hypothetical protein